MKTTDEIMRMLTHHWQGYDKIRAAIDELQNEIKVRDRALESMAIDLCNLEDLTSIFPTPESRIAFEINEAREEAANAKA